MCDLLLEPHSHSSPLYEASSSIIGRQKDTGAFHVFLIPGQKIIWRSTMASTIPFNWFIFPGTPLTEFGPPWDSQLASPLGRRVTRSYSRFPRVLKCRNKDVQKNPGTQAGQSLLFPSTRELREPISSCPIIETILSLGTSPIIMHGLQRGPTVEVLQNTLPCDGGLETTVLDNGSHPLHEGAPLASPPTLNSQTAYREPLLLSSNVMVALIPYSYMPTILVPVI
jgi:hypothetical protein